MVKYKDRVNCNEKGFFVQVCFVFSGHLRMELD